MFLRGLCSYLNSYCMLWCSVRVLDDIRQQVFRHTLGQSMEFFNHQKAGDLVQTEGAYKAYFADKAAAPPSLSVL